MVDKWIGYLGEKNVRKNTLFHRLPSNAALAGQGWFLGRRFEKKAAFGTKRDLLGVERNVAQLPFSWGLTGLHYKMNKERGRLSKEINQKLDGMVGFLLLQALSRLVAQLKLRGMDEGTKWKKLMSA
ncbi:hypothetical protein M0657_006687 [Pyricularia oryzae]|nr:hypothetical protein M9X92_006208 [Pyricularia oryzae]KAI7920236.1 hypothetical protein M0657_006687 [Pyricularia oryzae]